MLSDKSAPMSTEPSDGEGETKEQKVERLRALLGLSDTNHTFENFKVLAGTRRAYEAFKGMANGTHKPMLLCCGAIGNGKTYLCEALSISLYRKGIRCEVSLWSELRRRLLQAMHRPKPGSVDYDELFKSIRRRKFLIIDDVGMGSRGTEWEMSELEDIVNYRYRERLFTVMTTNRTLEELPERVVSRFFDPEVSEVVINEGKDYRIKEAK